MKSKTLIELLKKWDPSGELDVFVNHTDDISDVYSEPMYHDGTPTKIINNNLIKHLESGTKITIQTKDTYDCLLNHPNLIIDYSDLSPDRAKQRKISDEIIRNEIIQIKKEVTEELENLK